METNLFLLFLRPLQEAGVPYAVTGSVAGMIYGEPRLTHDIDLIVDLPLDGIAALEREFPADEFYLPPAEVIAVEVRRPQRGHFNIIHSGMSSIAQVSSIGSSSSGSWISGAARAGVDRQPEPTRSRSPSSASLTGPG